jgi:hypothetical protein
MFPLEHDCWSVCKTFPLDLECCSGCKTLQVDLDCCRPCWTARMWCESRLFSVPGILTADLQKSDLVLAGAHYSFKVPLLTGSKLHRIETWFTAVTIIPAGWICYNSAHSYIEGCSFQIPTGTPDILNEDLCIAFLRSMLRLLVTANIPSRWFLSTF